MSPNLLNALRLIHNDKRFFPTAWLNPRESALVSFLNFSAIAKAAVITRNDEDY
jgi:hypothetical protein